MSCVHFTRLLDLLWHYLKKFQELRIPRIRTFSSGKFSPATGVTYLRVRRDSFTCETWLIYMWDMTHLHVRHNSFTYETWLIYTWDTIHLRQSWLIYMWDMTHLRMRPDSFTHQTWQKRHVTRIWVSHVTHIWVSHVTHTSDMWWVMSHKGEVLRSLLIVATPYDITLTCDTWLIPRQKQRFWWNKYWVMRRRGMHERKGEGGGRGRSGQESERNCSEKLIENAF